MRKKESKNTSLCEPSPSATGSDQRREARQPVRGDVHFFTEDASVEADGHLVDRRNSGFRASHQTFTLRSGQIVRFQHADAQGLARVMWTRISGSQVESGFLILNGQS